MMLQDQTDALFEEQRTSWPLLGANREKLEEALHRQMEFDGYTIHVQCNPKRIVSSAAKVDRTSIEQRQCFLCSANRPPEEKSLWFGDDYEILCNPFPIFSTHFTIAAASHRPQVILPDFDRYLDLTRSLNRMVVFYNAPNCGASAPDHMHFQAGNRGLMPVDGELSSLRDRYGRKVIDTPSLKVTAIEDGLRRFLVMESPLKKPLLEVFTSAFRFMQERRPEEEPMINMLAYHRENGWQLLFFPREKHRPWQYFEEGERHILLSPASVDMGGSLITPLEKDYHQLTRENVEDIFHQISFSSRDFNELLSALKQK